jgi:hypothetical protein
MPKPTLAEVYALPPLVLDDNYDLHKIQTLLGTISEDAFQILRCSVAKAAWEDVPDTFGLHAGTVTLTFHDVTGDQNYLDAHQRIRANLTDLVLHVYNQEGAAVRAIHFYDLHFSSSKQKLDSGNGKPSPRVNTYTYKARREIALA